MTFPYNTKLSLRLADVLVKTMRDDGVNECLRRCMDFGLTRKEAREFVERHWEKRFAA